MFFLLLKKAKDFTKRSPLLKYSAGFVDIKCVLTKLRCKDNSIFLDYQKKVYILPAIHL